MNEQVTEYIDQAPDDQKEIMRAVRKILHAAVANVQEEYKWSRPVFKKGKDFAYLKTAKTHLSLGFNSFQKLDDPDNLLEGTGKDMRHIKIRKLEEINAELLSGWFRAVSQ
ncbi:MAG: DUF1801 domain-containing protein [Bacteroidales bacterium]|nr:DUF1801 domain-containing protein [Bacteroidales bacterium]